VVELSGALLGATWRVELAGRYLPPRRLQARSAPAGGDFQGGTVGLRGCPTPRLRRIELPVCLGLEAGSVRARGRDVVGPETTHAALVTATLGSALVVVVDPRFALWLQVEAGVNLTRPRFFVSDQVVFGTDLARLGAMVGVEGRFP
jgi:hypothetical protein